MKRILSLLTLSIVLIYPGLYALEHFEAPVPAGGKVESPDKSATVKLLYEDVSPQEVVSFYKTEFRNEADLKWHESEQSNKVILYDWGSREWHKITIDKKEHGTGTLITIKKDNWTWIIGTLVIRFAGVFIVLIVLMIVLYISGRIFSAGEAKPEKEKSLPVSAK